MYSIITGGSSGLGLEIAKKLIDRKQDIIILGRDENKLHEVHGYLKKLGGQTHVLSYPLELSSEAEIDGFCHYLIENGLAVKNVFNVAGSAFYGKIGDIKRSDIDQVLNANLIGLMLFSAKMSTHMIQYPSDHQRIISVLSTAALKGKKHETIYNAAKWGARGFLESLRDELSDHPIEVINVFPGGMKTPFWNGSKSGYGIENFMDPSDVARHIVNISLDESVLVTDITIGRPK